MTRSLVATALLAASLAACASADRRGPMRAFADGRYDEARAWFEGDLAVDPTVEALDRNEAGTVALIQGDVAAAHRHFLEAFTDMEDLSSTTGESVAAVVGPESTKRWKGDPYERCMNAYYLGVTSWLSGDVDNAAAAFKAGVLRDADSEEGAAQSDFALLWFLLAMAQRDGGHEDRGAQAFARARALEPKNPWLDPKTAADANVLVVVDLGLGPQKVPSGPHGAVLRFRPRAYRAAYAEVSAEGKPLGRTTRAVDVFHQAVTRGDKVIDSINAGKVVFKDVSIVSGAIVLGNSRSTESDLIGVGMILLGLLLPAEADVRQWTTLPGEVHVLTARLDPGEHVLNVDVRGAQGGDEPDLSREVRVTVAPNRLAFAWTRAAPAPRRMEHR